MVLVNMKRYIALIRGINISGKNKIPMNDLKLNFIDLGYSNVKTYLNSGNVIFDSSTNDIDFLTEQIENMIKIKFNIDVPVYINYFDNIKELLEHYPTWWGTDDKKIYDNIIFIIKPHTFEEVYNILGEENKKYEKIENYKNFIFWSYELENYRKTNWWSRTINTSISNALTIRTANTVKKIVGLGNNPIYDYFFY